PGGLDRADPSGLRPPGDGLRVHAEQRGHLARCQQPVCDLFGPHRCLLLPSSCRVHCRWYQSATETHNGPHPVQGWGPVRRYRSSSLGSNSLASALNDSRHFPHTMSPSSRTFREARVIRGVGHPHTAFRLLVVEVAPGWPGLRPLWWMCSPAPWPSSPSGTVARNSGSAMVSRIARSSSSITPAYSSRVPGVIRHSEKPTRGCALSFRYSSPSSSASLRNFWLCQRP